MVEHTRSFKQVSSLLTTRRDCLLADAYKTELVEAKRREEQMQTRIVALEGEVQKSRAQFQELEGSVTALASHLQVSV